MSEQFRNKISLLPAYKNILLLENDEKMEDMEAEEEEGDHCQCPKSLIALPPLRLSEAVNHSSTASTSHCYKCAGTYLS